MNKRDLHRIHDHLWEIPKTYRADMRVPARVYASETMLDAILRDRSLEQLVNVTTLPGIRRYAIAMPDVHEGYGFPIGGVAAVDARDGAISPGGIGYDINCGVRLLRSAKSFSELQPILAKLTHSIAREVPSGVGRGGSVRLKGEDFDRVLRDGAARAVEMGYGEADDLRHIESGGRLDGADADAVSPTARQRGFDQLGTLGSGNHFGEIQRVAEILDQDAARALGLFPDQVTVTLHSGSRGLGYQVCDDFLPVMLEASRRHGIQLPDRQLCCAPIASVEARRYMGAMAAAANFAFANRQLMTHWTRQTFEQVLGLSPRETGLSVVYDVCHNIAKFETHLVDGVNRKLLVHRKGATRAFPPHHPDTPAAYKHVGQPVLIPGDMGRYSFVLVGTEGAWRETFGSTCHGAGRQMSRSAAARSSRGRSIVAELAGKGIIVRSEGRATLLEEVPEAYKDVADVVEVAAGAGLCRKVARLRPIGVIKG
jgi:tRNA-splicing ligase RtcB